MRFIFIMIIGLFLFQTPVVNAEVSVGTPVSLQEDKRDTLSDNEKAAKEVKLVRRVNPEYPLESAENSICGHVVAAFTVTKKGTVKNIKIIESKPRRIFDKAAKNALKQYSYEPRVVNGKKVDAKGIKTKITFKLANGCSE